MIRVRLRKYVQSDRFEGKDNMPSQPPSDDPDFNVAGLMLASVCAERRRSIDTRT
jgi:hypothetical protein